ncbi:MAG: small, acid-soluble spore protein, H family [Clostridia bacterium]|jgi:H-type small acid-soluble spore protein|nr:small, acid-soluble spore protein, H family [Clostridia bacterium]
MDYNRVQNILMNKEKVDIFYDERPVWIQGVNENIAKVGFVDNFEEKDVYINDLYERNLYN